MDCAAGGDHDLGRVEGTLLHARRQLPGAAYAGSSGRNLESRGDSDGEVIREARLVPARGEAIAADAEDGLMDSPRRAQRTETDFPGTR